jgi:hypothetical protein
MMIVLERTYTETQIHSQKVAERGGGVLATQNVPEIYSLLLFASKRQENKGPGSKISKQRGREASGWKGSKD